MRSHFSAQTLAEVFRDLFLGEQSGVLVLNRDDIEKRIFFERGMILFSESSVEEERVGAYLLGEGLLSEGALREAQAHSREEEGTAGLARTLIRRELLARATLLRASRAVTERVVQSVFRWEGGSARFHEGDPPEGDFDADVLSTFDIILRGILGMAGFEPIHDAMRGLDNRLRLRRPAPVPLERMTLSPNHGFILSRVDGTTTLSDVISLMPAEEEEVAARFLFALLIMGIMEYDPPVGTGPFRVADILRDHADRRALERMQEQTILQAYSQMRTQNPHEILGVMAGASREEIRLAYEETKEQFSRERILPKVLERYRSELGVIESRLLESFLALSGPERGGMSVSERPRAAAAEEDVEVEDLRVRMEMDKAKSKLALEQANRVADAYYAKARKAVREGDFHNAIQYGKLAISYNQSDARYYFLLADCQARNPEARWQRMAEENLIKTTQLDPWNAEYWISLGRFYKTRGLKLRAKKQFEEALKLMPSNEAILEELDSLR